MLSVFYRVTVFRLHHTQYMHNVFGTIAIVYLATSLHIILNTRLFTIHAQRIWNNISFITDIVLVLCLGISRFTVTFMRTGHVAWFEVSKETDEDIMVLVLVCMRFVDVQTCFTSQRPRVWTRRCNSSAPSNRVDSARSASHTLATRRWSLSRSSSVTRT